MTYVAPHPATALPGSAPRRIITRRKRSGADIIRLSVLWLAIYFSSVVLLDVFYNIFILLALGAFVLTGLKLDRANMPFIFFLVIYNLGALIALQPYTDFEWSREFVIGTGFVATTAIFFCLMLNEDAITRLNVCRSAFIVGAVQAATCGILGYADIAGLGTIFSMYGRASGTFRDPNVLGPFLVLPALYLLWDLFHGGRYLLFKAVCLLIVLLGLFLSFSRGAWGSVVVGSAVLLALAYKTSESRAVRKRIVVGVVVALILVALLLAVALSVDDVAKVFADRFTLQKDYDSGPSGRFGNQKRSIPELLDRPFGYGPNRHGLFWPENPHNVYIMAFSSYGWLGGLTFLGYIASTFYLGLRNCFLKTPFQMHSIVIWSALLPHILQGFQIDSDRWRHLFYLYGVTWGLAAINRKWLILNRPNALSRRDSSASAAPNRLPRSG